MSKYDDVRPEAFLRFENAKTDDEIAAALEALTPLELDLWLRADGIDPDAAWERCKKYLREHGYDLDTPKAKP